jgi:hypothetical protein
MNEPPADRQSLPVAAFIGRAPTSRHLIGTPGGS